MAITNGYATLEEFWQRVGKNSDQQTIKESLVEAEIERNSRIIDTITSSIFYTRTITSSKVRYLMGNNSAGLRMSDNGLRIYFPAPIIEITSVIEDGVMLTENEDYFIGYDFIEAFNYFSKDRKYPTTITGSCGYTATPKDINEVCLAMTEVTTGLGTYTMIGADGTKIDVTRDNMPDWVFDRLQQRVSYNNYG